MGISMAEGTATTVTCTCCTCCTLLEFLCIYVRGQSMTPMTRQASTAMGYDSSNHVFLMKTTKVTTKASI